VESDARAALDVVVVLCAGINDSQVADKRFIIFVSAFSKALVDQVVKVKDKLAQTWSRREEACAA
jgi:hypothetical protein